MSHLGGRECRKRTPEELPSCRPTCARRWIARAVAPTSSCGSNSTTSPCYETVMHPTGLSKDGISTVYKRFELKAGSYKLAVKMNDNLVNPGWNHVKEEQVTLKPARVLVIDFNPDKGGLFFQQAKD
jgi:hypothetical protein